MTASFAHEPVMVREVLEALAPVSGGIYADATLGGGGHSEAILEASAPAGRIVALDRDADAVSAATDRLARFGSRATLVHADFASLGEVLRAHGLTRVDGLVADLGVSSPQLDRAERGFAFGQEGPLDMRMDCSRGPTLAEWLDRTDQDELEDVIRRFGEDRKARGIARSVLRARDAGELHTTADLRRAVLRATGPKRSRIDPATRTFQALRIAVNEELSQIEALLAGVPDWLKDGGTAVVISFHSLEDRLVKHAFRGDARLSPLTKRPLQAQDDECAQNPRSRSAKLRAAHRVARETALYAGGAA